MTFVIYFTYSLNCSFIKYFLSTESLCLCQRAKSCEGTNFKFIEDSIVCHDYQEIKIQESTQVLGVGSIPRSIPVILKDDLVDVVKAGGAFLMNKLFINLCTRISFWTFLYWLAPFVEGEIFFFHEQNLNELEPYCLMQLMLHIWEIKIDKFLKRDVMVIVFKIVNGKALNTSLIKGQSGMVEVCYSSGWTYSATSQYFRNYSRFNIKIVMLK